MEQYRKNFVIIILLIVLGFSGINKDLFAGGVVKTKETHQTMIGFGAAIAWYEGTLANHPKREEVYNYIFNDLGLDILRIRNTYRYNPAAFATDFSKIITKMYQVSSTHPRVLISSWSPPSDLKSNNNTNGGSNATLKKDDNGKYVYRLFAEYWADAIEAYQNAGIEPDYISLQNEPSFDASWESCRFEPSETSSIAGYGKALDTLYAVLQDADLHPKILAAEAHGIGYNAFQNYANKFNHNIVDGYCYHLYHGGTGSAEDISPDTFNSNLLTIGNNYDDKPIWQTEFDRGTWLQTAWLMQNSLVSGNVSAYLWWELIWGSGGKPLIELGGSTYTITKYYWAFRQFSKYIDEGWKRVTAESDVANLRVSAFANPEDSKLTIVIVNVADDIEEMSFDIQDFNVAGGKIIRTSETEDGVVVSDYVSNSVIQFPELSITTLSLYDQTVGLEDNISQTPSEFSLSQNYPNPFNPTTKIRYSLPAVETPYMASLKTTLIVYDILGREITTLVNEEQNPGTYEVEFNGDTLPSGIYLCKMSATGRAGNFNTTIKLMLIK
ncbi:MAG: T9SS type A sorting domain-containing protein [bacterium]